MIDKNRVSNKDTLFFIKNKVKVIQYEQFL